MPPSLFAKTLAFFGLLAAPALAEEVQPPRFLVNGFPLGNARTYLDASETRAYYRALAAFPNASACLKDGSDPATATLDLEAFSNLEELEVCLFLTADALRDLEAMRALLQRSGFRVHHIIPYDENQMMFRGSKGKGNAISGAMSTRNVPISLIGWLDRLLQANGLSVHILHNSDTAPVNCSASVNRL